MDLQSLVNKFKVIAGVYAFDILPDKLELLFWTHHIHCILLYFDIQLIN